MCGRYSLIADLMELQTTFGVRWVEPSRPDTPPGPRYNISPRQWLPVVLQNPARPDGPELRWMRWGIVPPWTPPEEVARFDGRTINARSETAAEKPTFKRPLALRRCLVPASSYYEWETREEPAEPSAPAAAPGQQLGLFGEAPSAKPSRPPRTRTVKVPHRLFAADGSLLVLAGIYEVWGQGTPQSLPTVSLFTRPADAFTARIHDRMPILLRPEDWGRWLDPRLRTVDAASTLLHELAAKPSVTLQEETVSSRVNSPGQDDSSLWEKVEA